VIETPDSPTRKEPGVIEPAVIVSGSKFDKVALVCVARVVPPEFTSVVAIYGTGVSELGFLKVKTRKVHLFSDVAVDKTIVAMLEVIVQEVMLMPVVADTQLVSVVLGRKEPGVGTLNTIVSPVAKKPVADVRETVKVRVATEPTVCGDVVTATD